jgi:hypothetical protein
MNVGADDRAAEPAAVAQQVHVATAQARDFAAAQARPRHQQHRQPVAGGPAGR